MMLVVLAEAAIFPACPLPAPLSALTIFSPVQMQGPTSPADPYVTSQWERPLKTSIVALAPAP
jgi:hypothetical protein